MSAFKLPRPNLYYSTIIHNIHANPVDCFQQLTKTIVRGGGIITHFRYLPSLGLQYPIRPIGSQQVHYAGRYIGMYFVANPNTVRTFDNAAKQQADVVRHMTTRLGTRDLDYEIKDVEHCDATTNMFTGFKAPILNRISVLLSQGKTWDEVWPQFFASEQSATTFLDGFTHPSGMLPEPLPGIRLGGRSNPFEKLKREAEVRDAKLLGRKPPDFAEFYATRPANSSLVDHSETARQATRPVWDEAEQKYTAPTDAASARMFKVAQAIALGARSADGESMASTSISDDDGPTGYEQVFRVAEPAQQYSNGPADLSDEQLAEAIEALEAKVLKLSTETDDEKDARQDFRERAKIVSKRSRRRFASMFGYDSETTQINSSEDKLDGTFDYRKAQFPF